MKVYHSNSEEKTKKKLGRKGILAIGVSAVMVVAAVAVTLVITLTGGKTPGPVDPPVNNTPTFVAPIEYTGLGKTYSKDKLVEYSTMEFWETHEAVDFLAASGASVMAISDGTVLSVDKNTSMNGTVIKIQHEGIVSVYKGLSADDVAVKEGDTVEAGDVIGKLDRMIMERDDYESAHLHLEILKDGKPVNPFNYITDTSNK